MPLADMQRRGSNAYVAWLRDHGFSGLQVWERLRRRFTDEGWQSIMAAESRGSQAWEAAQRLNQGDAGNRPLARDVPGSGRAGLGFRYTIVVYVPAPAGGGVIGRTLDVTTPGNATREELDALVWGRVDELRSMEGAWSEYEFGAMEDLEFSWHAMSVERAAV